MLKNFDNQVVLNTSEILSVVYEESEYHGWKHYKIRFRNEEKELWLEVSDDNKRPEFTAWFRGES